MIMSISIKQKRILIFVTVATVAITIRVILLSFWSNSPFRNYSEINGLDMKTLLAMGELFYHGKIAFSLYNLLIATVMLCNDGMISVIAIIIIQQLLGVFTSLLTTWISLKISGSRLIALLAGIVAALYAPALIYESVTLR